jgi:hypothetical protein
MSSSVLKSDLQTLKSKLENIELQLEDQMKELEIREEKWTKLDETVKQVMRSQENLTVVKFNVGGKKFASTTETLLKIPDTLFYKIVNSRKFNFSEEIFFDRSPKMFPFILDFIRYNKINYSRFNKEELEELKKEVEYYEIGEICFHLEQKFKEVEFVSYEINGDYSYNGQTAGTQKVSDLKDKDLNTGICAISPGWIIIELNNDWEFEEIEVAGWNGNSTLWYNGNGSGANIMTSKDKNNWKTVGTIPSNYASSITKVKLTKSTGRYIKFSHNSYVGLGYLNIKKL